MLWKIVCGIFTIHIRTETLEEAFDYAENYVAYTQRNMSVINSTDEEEYYISKWWYTPAEEHDEVLIDYGDFGFYEKWKDQNDQYMEIKEENDEE